MHRLLIAYSVAIIAYTFIYNSYQASACDVNYTRHRAFRQTHTTFYLTYTLLYQAYTSYYLSKMEAIGALLGQIAGLGYNTQNNNMDGNVLAGLAHNRHGLQGVMTEIQSFSQGLNLLLLALVVIVPVLSLSAIALDWAYFFRGISVDHTNIHGYTPTDEQNYDMGGTATPPMMVSISRGDGIQVTILKAVISSVIGFFVVQLLKVCRYDKECACEFPWGSNPGLCPVCY
ncbi:hypothetical protein SARC_08738 [Sphaeroforma arctica JP610]|uniref:Uncharacterized protein n=1 Tax=Sphaeroforma arctica JP610 TaxID=667725 RepID=A0A0L0FQ52_9EUKA|nr:hypothetical protein SARC_08738 [Sphaeroforma arctica JP610]KNC78844.1 hypothetical protein SARC_08738 [Sphaeroforma arctica JP610]|eukprot:XP_014152746.1 hypothetical protein SARC_08738 [Sphaeroforma arctica JP610]